MPALTVLGGKERTKTLYRPYWQYRLRCAVTNTHGRQTRPPKAAWRGPLQRYYHRNTCARVPVGTSSEVLRPGCPRRPKVLLPWQESSASRAAGPGTRCWLFFLITRVRISCPLVPLAGLRQRDDLRQLQWGQDSGILCLFCLRRRQKVWSGQVAQRYQIGCPQVSAAPR